MPETREAANVRFDTHLPFAQAFESPAEAKRQIIQVARALKPRPHFDQSKMLFLQSCDTSSPITSFEEDVWLNGPKANFMLQVVQTVDYASYLAISYCWSTSAEDEKDGYNPVNIRCLDGSIRRSRAPAKPLHRAIRQAWSLGMKYMWVDQECIDQEDEVEKENAIQSMDFVYRNADRVLCLLNCKLEGEDDIYLLESLHRTNRGGPSEKFDLWTRAIGGLHFVDKLKAALAFKRILETVATDKYWTRAWILQERLCSSGVDSVEVWVTCQFGLQTTVPGDVCVNIVDQLRDARELIQQLRDDKMVEQAESLLASLTGLESVIRLPEPASHRRQIARNVQRHYNALQVTSVLQSQECLIPSDKIALLANSLGWYLRLDTNEARLQDLSFSACVWAMALRNGDASVMCQNPSCLRIDEKCRHWAPRASTVISQISCSGLVDHLSLREINETGLGSEGWLFRVTARIDLSILKSTTMDGEVLPFEFDNDEFSGNKTSSLLQMFFWNLLKQLVVLKHHQAAELLWKATRCRARGGFYGRSLVELDRHGTKCFVGEVVDEKTGRVKIQLSDFHLSPAELATMDSFSELSDIGYTIHRNCNHEGVDETGFKITPYCLLDPLTDENAFRLLGGYEQLYGLKWIHDAVMESGVLGLGAVIDSHTSTGTRGENTVPDTISENIKERAESPKNETILFNITSLSRDCLPKRELKAESCPTARTAMVDYALSYGYVYVQHREVRKYKRGDGKAMSLVHPFEVWHKDQPDHSDAPFAWTAERQKLGQGDHVVDIDEPRCCIFDIQDIPRRSYTLAWPGEYNRKSW